MKTRVRKLRESCLPKPKQRNSKSQERFIVGWKPPLLSIVVAPLPDEVSVLKGLGRPMAGLHHQFILCIWIYKETPVSYSLFFFFFSNYVCEFPRKSGCCHKPRSRPNCSLCLKGETHAVKRLRRACPGQSGPAGAGHKSGPGQSVPLSV